MENRTEKPTSTEINCVELYALMKSLAESLSSKDDIIDHLTYKLNNSSNECQRLAEKNKELEKMVSVLQDEIHDYIKENNLKKKPF